MHQFLSFQLKKTLEKGGFQAIWGFWAFPCYIALPTFPLIKIWRFLGRLWLFCPSGRKLQQQVLYDNPFWKSLSKKWKNHKEELSFHHTFDKGYVLFLLHKSFHNWAGYSESSPGLRGGLLGGFPTKELQQIIRVKWLPSANETRRVLEASIYKSFGIDLRKFLIFFTSGFGWI